MTIERIKIVKSSLEKLFDKINPNWKEQILYQWQYGEDHPEELVTLELYNLEEYEKSQGGNLTIYAKGKEFIIEQNDKFGHTDVLTNIEPSIANPRIYDKKREVKEIKFKELDI